MVTYTYIVSDFWQFEVMGRGADTKTKNADRKPDKTNIPKAENSNSSAILFETRITG